LVKLCGFLITEKQYIFEHCYVNESLVRVVISYIYSVIAIFLRNTVDSLNICVLKGWWFAMGGYPVISRLKIKRILVKN
jgi:hypothetical protein